VTGESSPAGPGPAATRQGQGWRPLRRRRGHELNLPPGRPQSRGRRSSGDTGTLAGLLRRAAKTIERLSPREAHQAMGQGALLIDIRSDNERRRDGVVPGSLHIPRTVLEWRVATDSEWRNPSITGPQDRLILICDHGCSSVLAAATLVELGFPRGGDVVGGFQAWREAGLAVAAAPPPHPPGVLPGMGGRTDG